MDFRTRLTPAALDAAFASVLRRSRGAGADGLTPDAWGRDRDARTAELSRRLLDGTWAPGPLVRLRIPKPAGGTRRLAVPTVDDRVVVEVLRAELEPRIERVLGASAFAYRRGRSARLAVEVVSRRVAEGGAWVALADVRDFFDSVPLAPLLADVGRLVGDPLLLDVLRQLLEAHATRPGCGVAQGVALSPALSNLALAGFDRALEAHGVAATRYSDNVCAVAATEAEAARALGTMRRELAERGFGVKRGSELVCAAASGFPWLGFVVGGNGFRAAEGAVAALRGRLDLEPPEPASSLAARLEPILRGWAQYFDTPLPPGASLGRHDRVARTVLAAILAARHGAQPPDDAVEEDGAREDWAEEPETEDDDPAPVDAGGDRATMLDEAERLAAAGEFAAAEASWQGAMARVEAPPLVVDAPIEDEAIDAFLALFCAGASWFSVWEGGAGRGEYVRVGRPPGPADVRDHLAGRLSMAAPLRLEDGTCTLGCIDIDAPEDRGDLAEAVLASLGALVRRRGMRFLVEDTGGRGAHLWLPLEGRAAAADVARVLGAWCRDAGDAGGAVRVEAFPSTDEAGDVAEQVVALPLGIHRGTGRRSRLSWDDGTSVAPDLEGIFRGGPSALPEAPEPGPVAEGGAPVPAALPDLAAFGVAVGRVMSGCQLLAGLARRAAMVGHLSHPERTSLAWTLGVMGPAGHRAIHAIVGKCRNYDVAETERHLRRVAGGPLSCRRLQEKHPDLSADCRCDFGPRRSGYPTPLLHAGGFQRTWLLRPAPTRDVGAGGVSVHEETVPDGLEPEREATPVGEVTPAGVLVAPVAHHDWA